MEKLNTNCLMYLRIPTNISCSLQIYLNTGAIFIQQILHWNIYIGVMVMLVITAIYTALGKHSETCHLSPPIVTPQVIVIGRRSLMAGTHTRYWIIIGKKNNHRKAAIGYHTYQSNE